MCCKKMCVPVSAINNIITMQSVSCLHFPVVIVFSTFFSKVACNTLLLFYCCFESLGEPDHLVWTS